MRRHKVAAETSQTNIGIPPKVSSELGVERSQGTRESLAFFARLVDPAVVIIVNPVVVSQNFFFCCPQKYSDASKRR